MTYIDGFVLPVPMSKRDAYRDMAVSMAGLFKEFGVLQIVEAWGDDIPHGHTTDFFRAVKAEEGENVVFSWMVWPDKATRDEGWKKMMADERMKPPVDPVFDGKRMFWGGFQVLLDTNGDAA
jgi:uncharacterized protein YbaA (DUF1428 family)